MEIQQKAVRSIYGYTTAQKAERERNLLWQEI